MRRTFGPVIVGMLLLASLAWPSVASASCVQAPPTGEGVRAARVVFVGTVMATTNADRWATVAVEEVWKGSDIPAEVEVRAGPKDPPGPMSVASSNDRTYRAEKTYLFVIETRKAPAVFTDSACSLTTPYREDLERFKPRSATSPSSDSAEPVATDDPSTDDPSSGVPWWVVATLIGAGLAAVLLFLRSSRGSSDRDV